MNLSRANSLICVGLFAALTAAASDHWAYQLPKTNPPPEIKGAIGDVDRFILGRLAAKGIQPVGDADKTVLARRMYFDLLGLPPTPEQIDEFLRQPLERSIDQLLQSPHFGERWARHWL